MTRAAFFVFARFLVTGTFHFARGQNFFQPAQFHFRHRFQKKVGVIVKWRVQDLGPRAEIDQLALKHHRNRIGNCTHNRDVMGDEQIGHLTFFLQTQQKIKDAFGHQRIKGRGRLVTQDQFRLCGQGTRDRNTLLLSAGKFGRITIIEGFTHLDFIKKFDDFLLRSAPRLPK